MTPKSRRFLTTALVLGTAAAVTLTLPSIRSSRAQSSESIHLTGTVFDFRSSHADFDARPAAGYGHDAGLVTTTLGDDGRPVLSGTGSRVDLQWQDRSSNAIAPHLFADPLALRLGTAPAISKDVVVDMWDPSRGPYDPATASPISGFTIGGPMPSVALPEDLGPNEGDIQVEASPALLQRDIHCDRFSTKRDTFILVRGDCTIVCNDRFETAQRTTIELDAGASLRIYAHGFSINQGTSINMSSLDPSRVRLYNLSSDPVRIAQDNNLCAEILSPEGNLQIHQNDNLYGSFIGAGLEADQGAGLHLAPTAWRDACDTELHDTAGRFDGSSDGAITSSTSFESWYRSRIGTNMTASSTIELVRDANGIYEFVDDAFYPIDDRLIGNEGRDHNYHFTYMVESSFTYDACTTQFLELAGSDDIWAYVDDMLVIDLGGVQGAAVSAAQTIEMDRLHLADGETCTLRLFFAQRSSTGSSLRIRTNIPLAATGSMFTLTAPFD